MTLILTPTFCTVSFSFSSLLVFQGEMESVTLKSCVRKTTDMLDRRFCLELDITDRYIIASYIVFQNHEMIPSEGLTVLHWHSYLIRKYPPGWLAGIQCKIFSWFLSEAARQHRSVASTVTFHINSKQIFASRKTVWFVFEWCSCTLLSCISNFRADFMWKFQVCTFIQSGMSRWVDSHLVPSWL